MKFKALEVKELQKITVADSIAFLNKKTQEDWDFKIRQDEGLIEMSKMIKADYSISQNRIDSLKALKPDNSDKYPGRNPDEVLALAIQCKYSIIPPMINTTMEDTHIFILTPDGKTCYKKTKELDL